MLYSQPDLFFLGVGRRCDLHEYILVVCLGDFLGREEGAGWSSDDFSLNTGIEMGDGSLQRQGMLLVKGDEWLQ